MKRCPLQSSDQQVIIAQSKHSLILYPQELLGDMQQYKEVSENENHSLDERYTKGPKVNEKNI